MRGVLWKICRKMELLVISRRWIWSYLSSSREKFRPSFPCALVCPSMGWELAEKKSPKPLWVISGRLGPGLGLHPRDRVDLGCVSAILRKESETWRAWFGAREGQNHILKEAKVVMRRGWVTQGTSGWSSFDKPHRLLLASCRDFPSTGVLGAVSSPQLAHPALSNKLNSLPGLRALTFTKHVTHTVISQPHENPLLACILQLKDNEDERLAQGHPAFHSCGAWPWTHPFLHISLTVSTPFSI